MKIEIRFTNKELLAITNFFSLIGAKDFVANMHNDMANNPVVFWKTVNYSNGKYVTGVIKEDFVTDVYDTLSKYALQIKSTATALYGLVGVARTTFDNICKEMDEVARKHESRKPLGSFTKPYNRKVA